MSVWSAYTGTISLPPGTPDIQIRRTDSGEYEVLANGTRAELHPSYQDAHRWCQNTFRLTSTMMLPVYQDYVASSTPAATPNKYRKEPEQ